MKTVAQILKKTKIGDILRAGRRKWRVTDRIDKVMVATPANKATTFELWSSGIEDAAVIPGLKVVKK